MHIEFKMLLYTKNQSTTRYTFLSLLLFTGEWTPTQYYLGGIYYFF